MSHSIEPFPADIERESFGHYVSGLIDGEGCFLLRYPKDVGPHAAFDIHLRADDRKILELIRSFWQVGTAIEFTDRKSPRATYRVLRTLHLKNVLVPHFEHFPLRAKKANDFAIWKQGVALIARVMQRPRRARARTPGNWWFTGTYSRWEKAEQEHFIELCRQLKEGRRFNASQAILPSLPEIEEKEFDLFNADGS